MSQLDANALILLFTAYYFVERGLRVLLKASNATFYDSLLASRKDMVFFGISMGLLISLASTPSCVRGAWSAWHALPGPPGIEEPQWFLDDDAKACVTARAVLWVSELNRLDLYPLYVIHHAGSIISLLSFLYFQWPVLLFTCIFGTLGSEVPGDLLWMLSSYIDSLESPPRYLVEFKRRLNMFNVVQYALIRGGGIIGVAWILACSPAGLRTRSSLMQAHAYMLLSLYAAFCVAYVVRQFNSIRARSLSRPVSPSHIPIELDGPSPRSMHLRLPTRPAIIIVPYGVWMGVGLAALVFTSLTIAPASREESALLSDALCLTISSAIFFARAFSLVMEDDITRLSSQPLRTIFRPGFWLHGGLFGAAVGVLIAWAAGYVPNLDMFAASLALALPLYETFSRIGCHTYGCCYGCPVDSSQGAPRTLWRMFPYAAVTYDNSTDYAVTRAEPKLLRQPLIPIQLISATVFLLLFVGISLPIAVYLSPELAGAVTLACHAAIRLATETCRADYRGSTARGWISTTGRMAIVQGLIGIVAILYVLSANALHTVAFADWSDVLEDGRLYASASAVAVGTIVYGIHIEEIGTWIPEASEIVPEKVTELGAR